MPLPRLDPATLTARRAWRIWAAFALVFVVWLVVRPGPRGVTRDYWAATSTWWASSGDLYSKIDTSDPDAPRHTTGYLYLPQGVLLFTPFRYLPWQLDQILWRLVGILLLASGLRRVTRMLWPGQADGVFAWSTVLVLAASIAATKTGQTNLLLSGLTLHVGADVGARRWGRAVALLWIAMAAKPLAIVLVLLCGALFRPTRLRLVLYGALFAAAPYLHADWGYVTRQYGLALKTIFLSAQPGDKEYANLVWLLQTAGLDVPQAARTALQGVGALATLGASAYAVRRRGVRVGVGYLVTLAAAYMMLFNPRTETNSYVILAPYVAMAAAASLLVEARPRAFLFLAVLALLLGSDNYGRVVLDASGPWLKPLVTIAFIAWLLPRLRGPTEIPDTPASP